MKIHARKDEDGIWRDQCTGEKVGAGLAGICYVYGGRMESRKRTTSTISSSRPNVSTNLAIHQDQVASFNKQCGPGVSYAGDGRLHSTSYAAREREARRRGKSFG